MTEADSWRELRARVEARLADAGVASPAAEARWLTEEASGFAGVEWVEVADRPPVARAADRLDVMVERRVAGEPLQYVLGSWSFRGLDLMVDPRVLIPRPETEAVVEVALEEAARLGLRRVATRAAVDGPVAVVVADLGTGSGAIALALDAELADVEVWATDVSADALSVARANVAGCGATRVRLAEGSWFDALPRECRGRLALVVSNPPYVAEHELGALPPDVVGYEPRTALCAGTAGTEALFHLVDAALEWLQPGGVLVLELAPHQAEVAVGRARATGYESVEVRDDLTARPRVLVARRA